MINAAIVGVGRWGKTLVDAVQGSPRLRFVHGVSQEPDEVREFAARHGFRLSTDLKRVLADPEVQAVFLATPHSLHVEQVRAIAASGRAVWCEKPLALTRAEAARAVDACRAAGVVLASGNNKRCFASMRELKRVVLAGEPGRRRTVNRSGRRPTNRLAEEASTALFTCRKCLPRSTASWELTSPARPYQITMAVRVISARSPRTDP